MEKQIPISHHAWSRRANNVMSRIRTGFTEAFAENVSADCDVDLWRSDIILAHYTLSSRWSFVPNNFYKFYYAWRSYGSDTILRCIKLHICFIFLFYFHVVYPKCLDMIECVILDILSHQLSHRYIINMCQATILSQEGNVKRELWKRGPFWNCFSFFIEETLQNSVWL